MADCLNAGNINVFRRTWLRDTARLMERDNNERRLSRKKKSRHRSSVECHSPGYL